MNAQAVIAATIAMLAWGSGAIFDKIAMGDKTSALMALLLRLWIPAVIVGTYALFSGAYQELKDVPRTSLYALVAGGLVAAIIGQFAYFTAIKHADASRVVPFTASYPVVALILAVIVLREPLTVPKVVGTFMILGGLVLVSGILNGK